MDEYLHTFHFKYFIKIQFNWQWEVLGDERFIADEVVDCADSDSVHDEFVLLWKKI